MPTVYKLTSPDNEIYIGQTTKTFSKRWEEHIKASNYYHNGGCRLLNNKLKARGSETFIKEILVEWEYEDKNDPEKKKRDDDKLDEYEIKFIKDFNSFNDFNDKGLNLTTGGNNNKQLSQKTKNRISEVRKSQNPWKHRKLEESKELPQYIIFLKELNGYRISDHRNCDSKNFCDPNKSKEDNLKEAKDFLEKLEKDVIKIKKSDRIKKTKLNLPDNVQCYRDGFRINWKTLDGIPKTKTFTGKYKTTEEKLNMTLNFSEEINLIMALLNYIND